MPRSPHPTRSVRPLSRALIAGVLAPLVVTLVALPPVDAGASPLPVGNFATGMATELSDPGGMPPGSNQWSCRPSPAHPYPVILVTGRWPTRTSAGSPVAMLVNAG